MNQKKALITGIDGNVGSYLAEYLLEKGCIVHGLHRRKANENHKNINHIKDKITLIEGDITDASHIQEIIDKGKYDNLYSMAAQSHVGTSFKEPQSTINIDLIGVANILEGIRKFSNHTRMYQSSSSEIFGNSLPPQDEDTLFFPSSPYGVAKMAAHHLVRIYHQSYGLWCACGIMYNTESKNRPPEFFTGKVTNWIKDYKKDPTIKEMVVGNLESLRDWIHVKDACSAIEMICNQDKYFIGSHAGYWRDYCFGSGKAYKMREFLCLALIEAFQLDEFSDRFEFSGEGLNEKLIDKVNNRIIVSISSEWFRPLEVNNLRCNPIRIKQELGWRLDYSLHDIIKDMLK